MTPSSPGNSAPSNIFVTGFLRSGTSLLEKLLHSHPDISIAPQPAPFLFRDVKAAFLKEQGLPVPKYPLGDLFHEERYDRAAFKTFLEKTELTREFIHASFELMKGYSGQQTPDLLQTPPPFPARETLFEIFRIISARASADFGKDAARIKGAKEVFCEEFVPYFLEKDVFSLLILRDPRDVVASVVKDAGGVFSNASLNILFAIRQWRKSVALAIAFRDHPFMQSMRYEDLVASPLNVLNKISSKLDLAPFAAQTTVRDQSGAEWAPNTSHEPTAGGVNQSSVGRFAETLSQPLIALVEALAAPEMRVCGYERTTSSALAEAFRLPEAEAILSGYPGGAGAETESDRELRRIAAVENGAPLANESTWFIFPNVRPYLKQSATPLFKPVQTPR